MASEDPVVEDLILRLQYAEGSEFTDLAEEIEGGGEELADRIAASLPNLRGERARNACRALGLIGPEAQSALPALQSVAQRRTAFVLKAHESRAAEQAMLRICIDDPEIIRGAFASAGGWRIHEALDALGRWPEAVRKDDRAEVRDLLIGVIESGEPEVMTRALRVLPPFGRTAASAEEAAARRLTWPDPRVRLAAVSALHALRPQSASTAPLLVRALRDQKAEDDALTERVTGEVRRRVRSAALRALRRIAPCDEEVAAAVLRVLQSPQASLREHAARALGRIARPTEATVDALVERVTADDAAHVRAAAVAALGRMGADGSQAVSAMAASLADVQTRKAGAWALKQLGEGALPAAPALIDALDANERRRMVVVDALVGSGAEVLQDLRQGLHQDGRWQRIGCAEAVAGFGSEAAMMEPTVKELLFDRRPDVKQVAREALEAIREDTTATEEGDGDD